MNKNNKNNDKTGEEERLFDERAKVLVIKKYVNGKPICYSEIGVGSISFKLWYLLYDKIVEIISKIEW